MSNKRESIPFDSNWIVLTESLPAGESEYGRLLSNQSELELLDNHVSMTRLDEEHAYAIEHVRVEFIVLMLQSLGTKVVVRFELTEAPSQDLGNGGYCISARTANRKCIS